MKLETNRKSTAPKSERQNRRLLSYLSDRSFGKIDPNLISNKIEISDIKYENYQIRGLKAKKDLKSGEVLCALSIDDICITAKNVLKCKIIQKILYSGIIFEELIDDEDILEKMRVKNDNSKVSAERIPILNFEHLYYIFLIAQKRLRHSPYKNFILSLPDYDDFKDLPSFWNLDYIDLLPFEERQSLTAEHSRLQILYKIITKVCEIVVPSTMSNIHFRDDFLWAYSILRTRSFVNIFDTNLTMTNELIDPKKFTNHHRQQVKLNHYTINMMLVPFIDMVNHSNTKFNADVNQNHENKFELFLTENVKEGQEILINYNPESTSEILTTYAHRSQRKNYRMYSKLDHNFDQIFYAFFNMTLISVSIF